MVVTSLESSKETLGMEAQASSWGTSLSPWSRYTPLESNTPLSYTSSSSGSPAPVTQTAEWADVSADSQGSQRHQSKDVWDLCTEPFLQAGSRTLWPNDRQCWCPLQALSPGRLYSRGPSWSEQMMPSQMPVQNIHTQNANWFHAEQQSVYTLTRGHYLSFLNHVCKLPTPHETIFGRYEEEAVATVERTSCWLHQAHLNMPATCRRSSWS